MFRDPFVPDGNVRPVSYNLTLSSVSMPFYLFHTIVFWLPFCLHRFTLAAMLLSTIP